MASETTHDQSQAGEAVETGEVKGYTCDFCGEVVATVRRVALDRDYDRLRQPHRVMYSCPDCFERKEQTRTGADPAGA